ncbi:unnamed protein product [Dibothriocephalus latus]|uniref:Dynein light chain n=1 Tax=Dibothriocephalus latus TaxID=60516 RepID=A0A3P6SZA3_DIBLA|nr:unnamed protein product [Dibothriocephalus latus]
MTTTDSRTHQAIIHQSQLTDDQEQLAAQIAMEAMQMSASESAVAKQIKQEFDKRYNRSWNCIVGQHFARYDECWNYDIVHLLISFSAFVNSYL